MTFGVLKDVNERYPGAHLVDDIAYVTVGGDAIVGEDSKAAFNSYQMTCGRGDVTGDGVVPLDWTLLKGAEQVVLQGVLHSINEAGTTLPTTRWYGAEDVVDRWLPTVRRATGSGGIAGAVRTLLPKL